MIAEPRKTGLIGEIKAARYLRSRGYEIWAANFKSKTGEIDLVAVKGGFICFVEVKTRRVGGFFSPETAVDRHKEENVKSTAAAYMALSKTTLTPRFDIIEVIVDSGTYAVRHIKNAF